MKETTRGRGRKIRFACCYSVMQNRRLSFHHFLSPLNLGTVISRNGIVRDTASCHPMISRPDDLIRAPCPEIFARFFCATLFRERRERAQLRSYSVTVSI